MRKVVTILAATAALGAIGIAAPTGAQAQYYGGYITQQPYFAPRAYAPPVYTAPAYARPHVYVTPGYGSGAYADYRRFGDPTTRDSLATCAYC
jgi:hypothetical protein